MQGEVDLSNFTLIATQALASIPSLPVDKGLLILLKIPSSPAGNASDANDP